MYVGIDPSINSTGICVNYNDKDYFYIICPKHKIKHEVDNLNYIFYDKDSSNTEIAKAKNLIMIADIIKEVVYNFQDKDIMIVLEGISYGSSRTKALCDLAGLNYLIRERFIDEDLTIAPPAEIKKFATGKGNANKEVIVNLFKAIYPNMKDIQKVDDIADAYFMALYKKYMGPNKPK